MKKSILYLLFIVFMSTTLFPWSGHEAMTYYIIQDLPNIDKKVFITEYTYKEERQYNLEYLSLTGVAGKREFFCPIGDGVFPPDPPAVDNSLPVWQILTIYSPEPDNGMDEELDLHPLQGLIGNSQGVRHMRYKIGFLKVFEGDKSFLYFVELSKQAFEKNDEYWGYRFLARALHYIEDLSQPYHNAPGSFFEIIGAAFNKDISRKLNNAHYFMDDYLVYLLYYSDNSAKEVILGAKPAFFDNYEDYVQEMTGYSLSKFSMIHSEIKSQFGESLNDYVTIEQIRKMDEEGKLSKLKEETLSVLSYSSSIIKGFFIDFLESVGQI
jgi:hypothetical protein